MAELMIKEKPAVGNTPTPNPKTARTREAIYLIVVTIIILVLLLPLIPSPFDWIPIILIWPSIIIALIVSFNYPPLRRFWPQTICILFLALIGRAILGSFVPSETSIPSTSVTPTATTFLSDTAIFNLPADMIQSDLTSLNDYFQKQCLNNITPCSIEVILAGDKATKLYSATLASMRGAGNADHFPPYNKDAIKVFIRLDRGNNGDTARDFTDTLSSVKAIYILPGSSPMPTATVTTTPTVPTTQTFLLSTDKLASNNTLEVLPKKTLKVTVLLIVDKAIHRYDVTLQSTPQTKSTATAPLPDKTISITFTTKDSATMADFMTQLPAATIIYLFPTPTS